MSRLNSYQRRHRTREHLVITFIILAIAAGGGYHIDHVYNHPKEIQRSVARSQPHKLKPYVNYYSRNVMALKPDFAANQKKRAPKMVNARNAMAMDADTGRVIYQKNMNRPERIASVTKLMTLYLVEQKLHQDHHVSWNTIVNTSNPQLRRMGSNTTYGGFKFKRGHKYTVRQLFQAALIESSNNAAIALGDWVSGSNTSFVKLMNEQAKQWHLNAHFISSSGLENSDIHRYGLQIYKGHNSANEVSAKSVGVIAYHLLKQYPNVLNDSKRASMKVDGQNLSNGNLLLSAKSPLGYGIHVDGLKTGFTDKAGFCFVGTEKPNKHAHRIITVIFHDNSAFHDTKNLMRYVYANSALMRGVKK